MSFYLIDKTKGITSNKQLSKFKKEFDIKKAGFSGVLDPFATGLLIVATDGDTKFLDIFLNSSKTYSGTISFGFSTDTFDSDGKTIDERKDFILDIEELNRIVSENFIGKIMQTPPSYSNIKVNGKRAHELSRKNIEFELKDVERFVHSFELFNLKEKSVDFIVKVSSGTYIRSLANDIGKMIQIPSTLTSLRRESIGDILVPTKILKIKREEIIDFVFIEVSQNIMKDTLDGKEFLYKTTSEEFIITYDENVVWVKRIKNNQFKIYKRIQ